MKLIFCPKCQDIVRLTQTFRKCECGLSWGNYIDKLNATIGGLAIPLGLENSGFKKALSDRPASGFGRRFDAWVIPHACDTIEKQSGDVFVTDAEIEGEVIGQVVHKKKTELRVYTANLWGQTMVFIAHDVEEVMDYLNDNKIVEGIGPMDLSERIWEVPGYQDYKDGVTIICVGVSGFEYRLKEKAREKAERDMGAGI